MKLSAILLLASTWQAAGLEDLLTDFVWSQSPSSDCSGCTGFDSCGILEFCECESLFSTCLGYRQPGNPCTTPGPLIRIRANTKYLLTLEHTVSGDPTNVHTHGAHISGNGNQDDITRVLNSGKCLHYNWDVPSTQAGGTNWYHAHVHEHTEDQVSRGAMGMLVVEDDFDDLFSNDPLLTDEEKNNIEAFLKNEKQIVASKVLNKWYGNGVINAGMEVVDQVWTRVRFAASDPAGKNGKVEIVATSNQAPNPCETHVIAYDGVYTSSVPKKDITSTGEEMTGASRIDLAVNCTGVGSQAHLKFGGKLIATINVVGGSASDATPFKSDGNSSWTPYQPPFLQDLRNETVHDEEPYTYDIGMTAAQINGVTWDAGVALVTGGFNETYEWTLTATGAHPYHQHLYHMQIVTSGGCGHHEEGEFYDTISTNGACTVRFKAADLAGRCVFHCHVLSHEDNGSMSWLNVTNGPDPVTENPPVDQVTCGTCVSDPAPPPSVDCSLFLDKTTCNDQTGICEWDNKNKECASVPMLFRVPKGP